MLNKKVLSKIDLGSYTKPNPFHKDIIYDPRGQWEHPGQNTRIPGGDITMQGVPYPVYAQPNIGQPQMMYPDQNYQFPGADYVDEFPQMKKGGRTKGLVSMPKPSKKGLLSNKYSRSLDATNKLFTENYLFAKPKSRKNKVFDPNANYAKGGALLTKEVTCKKCGWEWDAADGGKDITTCHKCNGQGLVHAQKGGEYFELDLTPEEIQQYAEGGFIVEDISIPSLNQMQDGGTYTVKGSDGVYKKVNGKWQVDWNRSGKYQPLSKGDVKARTAVLDKMAKPLYDKDYDEMVAYKNLSAEDKINKFKPKKELTKEELKNISNRLGRDYKPEDTKLQSVDMVYPEKYIIGPGGGLLNQGLKTGVGAIEKLAATKIPGLFGTTVGQAAGAGFAADALVNQFPGAISDIGKGKYEDAAEKALYGTLGLAGSGIGKGVVSGVKNLGKALGTESKVLSSVDDVAISLESQIAKLKEQEVLAEESRKVLWSEYKAGNITAEEYTVGANKLYSESNPRFELEAQLRNLKADESRNIIKEIPQQNILKSKEQLGEDVRIFENELGSNNEGVYDLNNGYVAKLTRHGFYPESDNMLVAYADKIKSPRTAKVLQIKEIDGKVYQVQNKATGIPISQLSEAELKNIPKEHIDNFWKDKAELDELGLSMDIAGGGKYDSNIFYNPEKGFQIIDLGIGKSPTNEVIAQTYKGLKLPGSPNVVSSVDDVVKQPWQMEELPGLHLQSTMEGEAISKIVDKTGKINTEQALAIIAKESGGADKVALIKQGLGETIPKKIDFNEFRKTVQDQLIPLERQFVDYASDYGINRLGYKEPEFITRNVNGKTINELTSDVIENQTLVLSNKGKFGRGSSAHGNPDETLGHAHYLIDKESPNVLTVTQVQSDAFQGTHRSMPKNIDDATEKLNRTKAYADDASDLMGDEKEKFKSVFDIADKELQLDKATIENFTQKSLLDKNHQERYLQELVDYAGKRGDVNKLRLPTSETAAKVQGYSKVKIDDNSLLTNKEIDELKSLSEKYNKMPDDVSDDLWDNVYDPIRKRIEEINVKRAKETNYSSEHQTILKKYSEQPKLIKKLFKQDAKTITDSKGNTWYEFNIPEKFKKGKGEIKAFSTIGTGVLGLGLGAAQYKQGGASNAYIDVDLTLEEIKDLIAQGYVIEELN